MTPGRRRFLRAAALGTVGALALASPAAAWTDAQLLWRFGRRLIPGLAPPDPNAVLGEAGRRSAAPARPRAEDVWGELVEGNRRFQSGRTWQRPLASLREQTATASRPLAVVLACADSRVSPSAVFDAALGELCEIRSAGQVIDTPGIGSIEDAVEHLHVPLLLVLGHERCGAVAAAVTGEVMPTPGLRALVERIAPAVERARPIAEGEQLLRLAVEVNVRERTRELIESSPILRARVAARELGVVQAVYRLTSGEVVRLG